MKTACSKAETRSKKNRSVEVQSKIEQRLKHELINGHHKSLGSWAEACGQRSSDFFWVGILRRQLSSAPGFTAPSPQRPQRNRRQQEERGRLHLRRRCTLGALHLRAQQERRQHSLSSMDPAEHNPSELQPLICCCSYPGYSERHLELIAANTPL